jgi:predicted acetyltransferase
MVEMIDNIILVRPNILLKEKAIDYKQEHFDYGEQEINGGELWDKIACYEQWLEQVTNNADEKTVSKDWVVTDTFFAIRERDNKIIGMIDFRHTLNEFLKDFGNSGYSVRPTERNKGYATIMLNKVLQVAKEIGLTCIHLSVKRSNEASVKTILKNGGVYERSFQYNGVQADIYRVSL